MFITIEMFTREITYMQKKTWKNFHDFFPHKIRTNFFFSDVNAFITYPKVILTLTGISYFLYLIPIIEAFNNLGGKTL